MKRRKSPWSAIAIPEARATHKAPPERARKHGCSSVTQPAVKGAERAVRGPVGCGGVPDCRSRRGRWMSSPREHPLHRVRDRHVTLLLSASTPPRSHPGGTRLTGLFLSGEPGGRQAVHQDEERQCLFLRPDRRWTAGKLVPPPGKRPCAASRIAALTQGRLFSEQTCERSRLFLLATRLPQ
jgi:hypothetical protein